MYARNLPVKGVDKSYLTTHAHGRFLALHHTSHTTHIHVDSYTAPNATQRTLMEHLAAAAAAAAAVAVVPAPPAPHDDRSTRLSTEQRWTIVALDKENWSDCRIARRVGCHRVTVREVLLRYAATGSPGSGSRSGRPRVTTENDDLDIAVTARIERFTTPRRIRRQLQLDVSPRTVDRRLQEAGLFGRVAQHKRDFTPAQVQKRFAFADGYKDNSVDWWSKVLFSDEKCFYGKGFCGQTWVRREIGTALAPENCVHQTAHPVKVNVWACFCAGGQGYIYIFNENLDAPLMRRILDANLIPSARLHFASDPPEQWFLLHDNDKKFHSRLVQELLHRNGVTCLDFPSYSPDLNPIENLWATLAREVEKKQCDSIEELQDAIEEAWKTVDQEHMRKLAASMPQRCAAVIAANGWHTKY